MDSIADVFTKRTSVFGRFNRRLLLCVFSFISVLVMVAIQYFLEGDIQSNLGGTRLQPNLKSCVLFVYDCSYQKGKRDTIHLQIWMAKLAS